MTQDRCERCDLPTYSCEHGRPPSPTPVTAEGVGRALFGRGGPLAAPKPANRMRVVHPVAYQEPAPTGPVTVLPDEAPDTLHDFVTELIESAIHTTRRQLAQTNTDGTTTWVTVNHRTTSVSLIEQLDSAVTTTGAEDGGARAFASKPAARLDTLDALARIEHETYRWLTDLGVIDATDKHPHLADAIRQVRALAAGVHHCSRQYGRREKQTGEWCCEFHPIEHDVRAWWAQARVLSGWDSPAWKPDNTCPLCGVKGGLRVKLEAQSAVCCECGETWGPDRLGLLVEHVRLENQEDAVVETA